MLSLHEAPSKSFAKSKVLIGGLIILLTVGTTLASRITLNGGGNITFGQGVLNIKACDGWIDISFNTTTTEDGVVVNGQTVQALKGLNIDGFNSMACKNTNFKIKLYGPSSTTIPLDLYRQADNTISKQVWLSVNNSGVVSLLDTNSQNLSEFGDSAIYLNFDTVLGRYLVEFVTPVQPSANIGDSTYTVESGPNSA